MKVKVKSFATVVTVGRITEKTLDLPEGSIAEDAMRALGIADDAEMIVLVNGRPCVPQANLAEGDKVTLMPPVSAA